MNQANQENFLLHLSEELSNSEELKRETYFREVSSWDSMTALTVLHMIRGKYCPQFTDEDMISAVTVQDLLDTIEKYEFEPVV